MTTKKNDWLLDHRNDVASQFGEDGILEEVFSIIGVTDKWCVEFGAWDGVFCSNTHHLITSKNYQGVLIEADSAKMPDLQKTYAERPDQYLVNRFVDSKDGPNSLDNILAETPIPTEFDLLSIDIDSDDYHVWASLKNYNPKVVVIEFNPTIPTHLDLVQPIGNGHDFGASLLALYNLAKEKGYELVCATDNNGIFVQRKYFEAFEIEDNHPQAMWGQFEHLYLTYLYQKYDSTLVLAGNDKVFWYTLPLRITAKSIQLVPSMFRFFPASVSRLKRAIAQIYVHIFRSSLKYPADEDWTTDYMSHLQEKNSKPKS